MRRFKLSHIVLILITILLTSSCTLKTAILLSKAKLKNATSSQVIPYKNVFGLCVIPVQIEGKTYHFVVDSGAQTTLVTQEIANQLQLKDKGSISVRDSQNNSQKLQASRLDKITIGENEFTKVGTVVVDIKDDNVLSCLNIDGIIGMNVMRLNNWLFDYEKEKISNFELKKEFSIEGYASLPFKDRGTPKVELYVNGIKEQFTLDTGKKGKIINVSNKASLQNPVHQSIGYTSFGLHNNTAYDTSSYFLANITDSSSFIMNDVLVEQIDKGALIGNGFFSSHYHTIYFDFDKNVLYFNKREKVDNTVREYPFSLITSSDGLVVSSIAIDNKTLTVGDTIFSLNDIIVNKSNKCDVLKQFMDIQLEQLPIQLETHHNNSIIKQEIKVETILFEQ